MSNLIAAIAEYNGYDWTDTIASEEAFAGWSFLIKAQMETSRGVAWTAHVTSPDCYIARVENMGEGGCNRYLDITPGAVNVLNRAAAAAGVGVDEFVLVLDMATEVNA